MKYYINDNRRIGLVEVFEAESIDAVVAEQTEMLKDVAAQWYNDDSERDGDMTLAKALEKVIEEFRNSITVMDETNERVIFDNCGGVTVQLKGWAHYYDNPKKAAEDVANWITDGNTDGWEGREDDALVCDPTYKQVRNGGYRIWNFDRNNIDVQALDEVDSEWFNEQEFFEILKGNMK